MASILIVEDNAANLELMRVLLEAGGHACRCKSNGLDSVMAALDDPPDLVLCDIQMPGIDGVEVLRRLRTIPSMRGRPVVAVTAMAMLGDRERLMGHGFDGYLAKPIEPRLFRGQVEAFLIQGGRNVSIDGR